MDVVVYSRPGTEGPAEVGRSWVRSAGGVAIYCHASWTSVMYRGDVGGVEDK